MNGNSIRRTGFSLLEVLLSLSLAVVLFGSIFAAVSQSWRLTASGREEMQRSQIARALIRKLEVDIRSVMFTPAPLSDAAESTAATSETATSGTSTTGATTGATTDATAETSTVTSGFTEDEPSSRSRGIKGTATQLDLHISRARRDLNFATNADGQNLQTRTSDLMAVTYAVATPGVGSPVGGLTRSEGDRLMVMMVEDEGGVSTSLRKTQVLAPEVASIAFRYYDGAAWYTEWDSETNAFLPRAIEVTIVFVPPPTLGGPMTNVAVSSSMNQFRTVILVPVADPMPKEMLP